MLFVVHYSISFDCIILSCDIPVVLDTIRWYRIVQSKTQLLVVFLTVLSCAILVVVVTPSSLRRLLVILYQDFLGNF